MIDSCVCLLSMPVPSRTSWMSVGDGGEERTWFSSAEEEAPGHKREVIHDEAEVPARFMLSTLLTARERAAVRQTSRRVRRTAPHRDLRRECASLVELLTSYFLLLGAGARRAKSGAEAHLKFEFPTRGGRPALRGAAVPRGSFYVPASRPGGRCPTHSIFPSKLFLNS